MTDYAAFAQRLTASGVITDPWQDGEPRFSAAPVVLEQAEARVLLQAGEDLALVYDELVQLVADDPALLRGFFGLTPTQEAMFMASAPLWHTLARADVFLTDEGPRITELNSDTPTGEPEAVVLGALGRADHPDLVDPNTQLCPRFLRAAEAVHRATVTAADAPRTMGLVYPTEFTEDLSLVRLWRSLFQAAGWRVVLGSPYNLTRDDDGFLRLFQERVSLVVRHYKTDWWGERQSAWREEEVMDQAPLLQPLLALLGAVHDGTCALVNPFGAVVAQNKRAMAFMWERIHRFSVHAQGIIERLVPYTARLETVHEAHLTADRPGWVLKSDYGAEGDEVIVGRFVDDTTWRRCLDLARPGRWVAQRCFVPRLDEHGKVRNHGVFVVAGEACGLYTRVHDLITDDHALSVPTLVRA